MININEWDILMETGGDCTCRGPYRRKKELASFRNRFLKRRSWLWEVCDFSNTYWSSRAPRRVSGFPGAWCRSVS